MGERQIPSKSAVPVAAITREAAPMRLRVFGFAGRGSRWIIANRGTMAISTIDFSSPNRGISRNGMNAPAADHRLAVTAR